MGEFYTCKELATKSIITIVNYLLACGPYRVPFLLNLPDATEPHLVIGELYTVLRQGLSRLDELEGMSKDHYERLLIRVEPIDEEDAVFGVEMYYGHRSYGSKLLFL
ncbi:hypothetical protein D5086_017932 [Populus alba]|uniref:Uncharacterized protein n=1 Tax=Populus alba TaxID=43335 RepID=A0ACC4BNW3_POPAL